MRFPLAFALSTSLPLLLPACALAPDARLPEGPLAQQVSSLAAELHVPRDLVLAIAQVEGGLRLPRERVVDPSDHVPVGGILELRHGGYNSLARGAELVGYAEDDLRAHTDLGTIAGVRVLAELGAKHGAREGDLASWRATVEELAGIGPGVYHDQYLHDVFTTLRDGGAFPAREGETVYIAPHPELPVDSGPLTQGLGNPPPDFPGAIWFPTDCTNKCTAGRPDGDAAVNTIVIHDTEGGWAGSVSTLQFDAGKSVHYIVDADGSRVGQFLHETDTAWHAGNWCYNKHSIGIEHVGVASDPNGYQTALYKTSVRLVENIRTRWKVPLDRLHIVGHYQVPNGTLIPECSPACSDTLGNCEKSANYGGSGNHRDPGYNWQWCQYMQMLGGSCTCNDAYPLWNCTTDKTLAVRCNNGQVEIEQCAPCESMPLGVNDVCHNPMPPAADLSMSAVSDMATAGSDAGAPPANDLGGLRADGAKGDGGGNTVDGGCKCEVGSRGNKGPTLFALALLLALALRPRRRS